MRAWLINDSEDEITIVPGAKKPAYRINEDRWDADEAGGYWVYEYDDAWYINEKTFRKLVGRKIDISRSKAIRVDIKLLVT